MASSCCREEREVVSGSAGRPGLLSVEKVRGEGERGVGEGETE